MDVSRLVTLTYITTAIVAFVIFQKTYQWIETSIDAVSDFMVIPPIITLTTALAVASVVGLVLWMKRHPKVDPFLTEVIIEMKKVTWPSWKETQRSTIVVIIFSIILSFFLWGSDQVWKRVTDYILTIGI
ncbi:preprotein translocase subunit SecE [Lujinxingia litoralis]|nr:preprotein translocase subunit SecE [Lujinxingia litoralis]